PKLFLPDDVFGSSGFGFIAFAAVHHLWDWAHQELIQSNESSCGTSWLWAVRGQPDPAFLRCGFNAGERVRDQEPEYSFCFVLGARDYSFAGGLALYSAPACGTAHQMEGRSGLGGGGGRCGRCDGFASRAGPAEMECPGTEGGGEIFRTVAGSNCDRQFHPGQ